MPFVSSLSRLAQSKTKIITDAKCALMNRFSLTVVYLGFNQDQNGIVFQLPIQFITVRSVLN